MNKSIEVLAIEVGDQVRRGGYKYEEAPDSYKIKFHNRIADLLAALENLVASVNDGAGGAVDDAREAISKEKGNNHV